MTLGKVREIERERARENERGGGGGLSRTEAQSKTRYSLWDEQPSIMCHVKVSV